jgi:hypothetical protein
MAWSVERRTHRSPQRETQDLSARVGGIGGDCTIRFRDDYGLWFGAAVASLFFILAQQVFDFLKFHRIRSPKKISTAKLTGIA